MVVGSDDPMKGIGKVVKQTGYTSEPKGQACVNVEHIPSQNIPCRSQSTGSLGDIHGNKYYGILLDSTPYLGHHAIRPVTIVLEICQRYQDWFRKLTASCINIY